MKDILFYTFLITIILAGCTGNTKPSKNSNSITKNESVAAVTETDSENSTDINSFEEFYKKIPAVQLSKNMHTIVFTTKSEEYQSEMNSDEYAKDLGIPEGKILSKNFVVIIYSPITSGYSLVIRTYTRKGEKIDTKSLMGTEGIGDINDPNTRYEDTKLYMDKDLNIYNYYKDGSIKAETKDTVITSFKKEYYKIDESGKIVEIKK